MKITARNLYLFVIVAALGMPHLTLAGTTFTLAMTPLSDSAVQGTATNISYASGLKATASGSYTGGAITLSSTVTYANGASATPGITVTFPNNPFGGNASPLNATAGLAIATTSGTLAGTYTVTMAATNTSVKGTTATYTLTVSAGGPFNPILVWSPAGLNTNWSTAGNWSPGGPPGLNNDVQFLDLGAAGAAGTVDNFVDSSLTIGSLNYGQTNNFHTTLIASGSTLTVVDNNGLAAGTGTDNGPSQTTVNTVTGVGGTLIVSNLSALVNIGQANAASGSGNATLDMSGLGTFKATVARLLVGVDFTIKGDNGTLNLARTNVITLTPGSPAPQIDIGDNSLANGTSGANLDTLLLGQTNAFYVDSIEVGRGRVLQGGTMLFNSAAISPAAYFRGTNGSNSRVGTWSIGDGNTGKLASCHGTNDFSLGTVDALVNTMTVGMGSSATGTTPTPGTGTLNVNAGIIDVNNLNIGLTTAGPGTGSVNLTGGTLLVNSNLVLAAGGPTAVATLNVSSATVTANNGITVGDGQATLNLTGSTLNATNSNATIGTSSDPLGNFNVTGSTLNLALQNGAPSMVTTNLTIGGLNTINIGSVPLLTGFPSQFQLIQYGLDGGTASGDLTAFVLGTLPGATPVYGAYLSNNVANSSIDIVFTNGPFVPALTWDGGASGDWDISATANWKPKSGPDTVYVNTSFVTFDDTLTGTTNINLTTTLLPGSLTINNSAVNYIFSGAGKISGATGLSKQGAGTLVLDNNGPNDFSGGVTIAGGTLQIGSQDANGNLPAGPVADNGNLTFSRTDNVTISNVISGAGMLAQNGNNILTLNATNALFNGAMIAVQGTLQAGNGSAFGGATNVTVNSGATLDVNGQSLYGGGFTNPTIISGAGVGGNGALVNNGASQSKVLHLLTLAADATIGGSGDIEIRNSSGNSATADGQLNGAFNLTKTGTNNVSFKGVTMDPNLGNLNVQAGSVTISGTASALIGSLGNAAATATVFSNATLTLDTIGNIPGKNFVLTNGGILKCAGTNTLASPLTLTGAGQNAITVNSAAQFTITSIISGPGGFTKNGANVLFLNAANTYTGNTVLSGGTLALYAGGSDGSIAASANINISSGAILDVSGRSDATFTLGSGQALNGGAGTNASTVNGNLTSSTGSTVTLGGGNAAGILSIINSAILQGTTVMKVSGTNGNDQIDATGITYGGTLMVTNFSGIITDGQTFQLFTATNGSYSSGIFSSMILPAAAGLTWTNNLAVNGTITAGVVTGPPPVPVITHIGLTGTTLRINGSNGPTGGGGTLYILSSTNVALPLNQWMPVSTNTFFGGGTFNVTNTVDPTAPQTFYRIKY